MPVPQRFIDRFGSLAKVPAYIRRHFTRRAEWRRQQRAAIVEAEAARERERERIRALRRPPRNVRLHSIWGGRGRKVTWEPPETADQLAPAGYWVSELRNGAWTKHGNYLLPHVREAVLYGMGPASVETWYHQMKLEEGYSAPAVPAGESPAPAAETADPVDDGPNAALIEAVRGYLDQGGRPPLYYARWQRVLAGLGAAEHDDPMTASEAQGYVDRGWGGRWPPVVEALRRIEATGS